MALQSLFQWLRAHGKILKIVFYIAIISIIVLVARDQFAAISGSQLREIFVDTSMHINAIIMALGLIAFSATGLYDLVASKYAGVEVSPREALKIGWIAQAFNNFAGFGGLTGGTIRAKYYTWAGADRDKSIGVSASVWAANLLGLFVLLAITLPYAVHFDGWLIIVAIISCMYLPLFFLADRLKLGVIDLRKTTFAQIGMREKWNLLGASVIDWAAAGLFFWACVRVFTLDFSFPIAIFIFATATLAGLLSFLPAGAGSFDLTVIALCAKLGLDTNQVLLGLVLYRVFYYIVPWLLATVVWVADSVKELESDFPHRVMARVLALVTVFSSLLLFISALTPEIASRIQIIQEVLPSTVRKASHLTVLFTAVMLLILARGINQRVRRCYQLVLVLLGVAAVACLARGIDYEEAIYLAVFALALFASRSAFDRDPLPLKWSSFVPTAALAIAIPIVLSSWHALRINKVVNVPAPSHHANTHWPMILFYVMLACAVAIAVLFSRCRAPEFEEPCEEQTRRFEKLIAKWGGNAFSHLYYLGDKQVFFTVDKRNGADRAALLYRPQGTTLIALGDPFGDPDSFNQLFADFIDYADTFQCSVAFYEVGEEHLARCVNEGMSLVKLGEDATVDISGFTRVGSKGKTFRRMHNKLESSACTFEIVEAPYSPDLITELRDASQAWLGKRTEMSFSLGFFDESYLSRAPIAIVRSADSDRIEGFASLMPQGLSVASVDLMRIRPDAPDGVMDGIFVNLMEWAKNHGYTEFNFGMAPMSNTGARPHSRLSEKTIYLVYNYGGRIYNFRGLRNYKEKFKPVWKSRYLTYTDVKSLPAITASLSKLINRPGQYSAIALSTSEDEMPAPEMAINAN
ncbi:bifunctional lysylphosphatidylglycerol flippase/synthetase MprF [Corynebacterium amycolatum]|uniref:bifunctional lysylphosphatidylglycerol flippase/synthetase MprF n=1 Tax=Corynebacterium amycolatum TaxID=43765 RepID=UPI0012B7FC5B|nr:bifunctional lysylphosphatidylglycerol flippase/synthetase MprF [Corynebacterium amycolatum]KAA9287094.1 bifunctional lysylphosphatidylglycerol flippase/synthetase MprF [Corynebacterium amycolatum]